MAEYLERESILNAIRKSSNLYVDQQGINLSCELISAMPAVDVQPIVYAHKTINVGRRSYCSNCGKLAIMEDFCSKCGAKVEEGLNGT